MAKQFKFKNAALMMALAAAYPLQSYAVSAGVAQFTTGDVTVRRGTTADALAKGGQLESGDSIVTGAAGRAQLRFSDGGLVSLQPNSQFNISKYADANDPKQDAFLVDLLRGGMRAITGLIGKRNRDNYKVTTTTATIGIRGSAFLLSYQPDGTLVVSTELDAIEVCTKGGCTGLTAGESARVISADQPAVRTSTRANIPVPDPTRSPVVAGDNTRANGASSLINQQQTAPFSIFAGMAFTSFGVKSGTATEQRYYPDGALTIRNSDGNAINYLAQGNAAQGALTGTGSIISSTGSATAGDLMILGTWTGSSWTGDNAGAQTSFGFATGLPTPTSAISNLSGMRGEYALASATPVFSTAGVTGTVLDSSKLTVDFLGAGTFADVNLDVRMPGLSSTQAPAATGPAIIIPGPVTYNLRGGVNGTGFGFAGNLSVSSAACILSSNDCGIGSVQGFLGGPAARSAGLNFSASGTQYGTFGGAATFSQTSTGAIPAFSPPLPSNSGSGGFEGTNGWFGAFIDASGKLAYVNNNEAPAANVNIAYPVYRPSPPSYQATSYQNTYSYYCGSGCTGQDTRSGSGNFAFTGEALTGWSQAETGRRSETTFAGSGSGSGSGTTIISDSMSSFSILKSAGSASQYGAIGKVTDTDFIGWGSWVQGTCSSSGNSEACVSGGSGSGSGSSSVLLDQVHYIVGKPTPSNQMPTTGSAVYSLVGGTAPTANNNGVISVGQLTSGALAVNFGTGQVGVDIGTKFGSTVVNISVAQSTSNNYLDPSVNINYDSTFRSNGCGGTVQVTGFFAGNAAYRAGLVYRANQTAVGDVSGAAAFQRTSGTVGGLGARGN